MREAEQVFLINPMIKKHKKKYIIGTDQKAAAIFVELCTRNVKIDGFIDDKNAGILFFNKPVFAMNNLNLDEEDVLLLSQVKNDKYDLYKLCTDICILNPKLYGKKVMIVGGKIKYEKISAILQNAGIQVIGVFNNDQMDINTIINEKSLYNSDRISNETVLLEIENMYDNEGRQINIQDDCLQKFYLENFPFESMDIWIDRKKGCRITPGAIAQLGEYLVSEQIKEIILYGNNISLGKRCAEVYECLDFVPVSLMTDEDNGIDQNIFAIDEIIYKDDCLVLIYEEDEDTLFKKLYTLGIEERRCGKVYPWTSPNFNTRRPLLDIHMGFTYEMNYEYPGIYMYGENQNDDLRVVVLGGSTTDSMLDAFIHPWVEIMYERYCQSNITIFNGGISGYYSGQELLKLKRDLLKLNPDICIVYDGYNDLMQGVLHKKFKYLEDMVNFAGKYISEFHGKPYKKKKAYLGIPSSKNPIDDWLENIECMYAITNSRNIKFFSFMQPMLFTKKNLDVHSNTILKTMMFHGDNEKFLKIAKEYRERAENIANSYSYIYDFTHIFDNDDVYVDIAHVYDKGNEIIAESIWNVIKDSIQNILSNGKLASAIL